MRVLNLKIIHVHAILRIGIGIIFIWASYDKILNPAGFERIIQNYRILPEILIKPVAIILPWVEALAGLLLISGFFIKGAALLINFMMLIFMAAFMLNLYRGIDISCGCFTQSAEIAKSMYYYLLRDLLILSAGVWVFIYKLKTDKKT